MTNPHPETYANVAGNYYNKYETKNPVARYLVSGFFRTFDQMTAAEKPLKIYEVGCGEGILSRRLADKGHKVDATDIDQTVIAQAQSNDDTANLNFSVHSVFDLKPGSLSSYDLVVCCEVLEHLPNPGLALKILAESGAQKVVLSVPREPLWRVMNMARLRYLRDFGNTPGHVNHWSKQRFISFIHPYYDISKVSSPLPWTFVTGRLKHG